MLKHRATLLVPLVALLVGVAACGSSGKASPGGGSASGGASPTGSASSTGTPKTFKIGVITDETGLEASANKGTIDGVKAAAAVLAKQDNITLDIVTADSATSATAVLSAAQKLVTRDKVSAIVLNSAVGFLATTYLTQQKMPVVGFPSDGPEWLTSANMFSITGPLDSTKVTSVEGQYFKLEGGTVSGALGYSIAPQSAEATKAVGISAMAAGLRSGYTNTNFPFSSTNVQPVALAMKQAGVDSVSSATDQNSGLALLTALRQVGVTLKVATLSVGYGADTLSAGAGAIQAAQDASFLTSFEPVEMQTAATKQFQQGLQEAGVPGEPSYSNYIGYAAGLLLAQAFKGLPSGASTSAILTALTGVTSFDAGGLLGDNAVNPNKRSQDPGDPTCSYFSKLSGSTFVPVQGATPLCGKVLSQTVSAK